MAKELYVGHLSEQTTEEDLRRLFSVMGVVTSVHLIIDPETREFKRCGYVRMAAGVNPNEVVETLDGAFLIDREIHVSIARPQKPGMGAAAKTLAKKPWLKGGPKPKGGAAPGTSPKGRPPAKAGKPAAAAGPGDRPARAAEKPGTKPAAARPSRPAGPAPSAGGSTPRPRRKP